MPSHATGTELRAPCLAPFQAQSAGGHGAVGSLLLLLLALLADFLANDKPYYMVYRGKTYWPIVHSYLESLGLAAWPEEQHVDFTQLPAERVLFPLSRIVPVALTCFSFRRAIAGALARHR